MSDSVRTDRHGSLPMAGALSASSFTRESRFSPAAGLDAFAQVFAQMSAPAPNRPAPDERSPSTDRADDSEPEAADDTVETEANDLEPRAAVPDPAAAPVLAMNAPSSATDVSAATAESTKDIDGGTVIAPANPAARDTRSTEAPDVPTTTAPPETANAESPVEPPAPAMPVASTANASEAEPVNPEREQKRAAVTSTMETHRSADATGPAIPGGTADGTETGRVGAEATAGETGDGDASPRDRRDRRGGRDRADAVTVDSARAELARAESAQRAQENAHAAHATASEASPSPVADANSAPEAGTAELAMQRAAETPPAVAAATSHRIDSRAAVGLAQPSAGDATATPAVNGSPPAAGSASGSRPDATSSRPAGDAVTRAKLVQRVSKAFQHLGTDGGTVRLRLAPAELGSVRVEVQVQGRSVRARVVAETEAASEMLREHLGDLRGRLESQGMQIERIEIETDERSFERQDDSAPEHGHQHHQGTSQRHRSESPRLTVEVPVSRPVSPLPEPALVSAGVGVDVRL